jgi:hypothetical protein
MWLRSVDARTVSITSLSMKQRESVTFMEVIGGMRTIVVMVRGEKVCLMAEYIDREKLIAEYDRVHIGEPGGARKLMVEAPAADVVEVVRCKDCNVPHNEWVGCPHLNGLIPPPMFYCAYGERKEGIKE